jgi:hypothetical protein
MGSPIVERKKFGMNTDCYTYLIVIQRLKGEEKKRLRGLSS